MSGREEDGTNEEVRNDESERRAGTNSAPGGRETFQRVPTQRAKVMKIVSVVFFVSVILMTSILCVGDSGRYDMNKLMKLTVILSLVQTAGGHANGLPLLLGTTMFSLISLLAILGYLVRANELKRRYNWFVYFIGVCIMLESIFTNVVIFK